LTKEKLKSLKLIDEKNNTLYPTKGLLILLGVNENCRIKCARFKGVDMSVFIDKKEYSGNLFSQLKNAEIFIKNHINVGPQITQLKNKEVPEIPYVAIREALVNAVVHRDYSNLGRDVKIGIYDDIVNIVSPGGFPSTLTQDDVLNGRSEIRNRVIARVFKELGYIEQWGSGVQRMISSCQEYGLEVPTIMEKGDSVEVNIFRNQNSAGEAPKNVGKNKESAGEVPEKIGKEEQKKLVLKFLETNEKIIRKDVEKILSVGVRRARFILAEMVKEVILIKCGKSSNTYYILNQKNNR
jgi:ATP-dependent DNA helicase RecG